MAPGWSFQKASQPPQRPSYYSLFHGGVALLILISLNLGVAQECGGSSFLFGGATASSSSSCEATASCTDDSSSRVLQQQEEEPPKNRAECGLYMAESSIPHAGWGMYTADALQAGETLFPLDVAVQVADYDVHVRHTKRELQATLMKDDDDNEHLKTFKHPLLSNKKIKKKPSVSRSRLPKWLMNEYYWEAGASQAPFFSDDPSSICPGFGMLANSHASYLANLENDGAVWRQEHGPHGWSANNIAGPDAGASSGTHNLTFTTNQALPAGHELFATYGDDWFAQRTQKFGTDFALSDDYEAIDDLLVSFEGVVDGELDSALAQDTWELVQSIVSTFGSGRRVAALPRTTTMVDEILTAYHGKTAYATVPDVIRSKEWLEQHGMCLDHLHSKDVWDETTGRGAYATRFLPAGSVVAPVPVIHLSRNHLKMHLAQDGNRAAWQGYQLLLNYVYGHKDSSVVLFPYSPAVNLINHASPPATEPNVKLQWSARMTRPEMLEWTVDELMAFNKQAGLLLELVALRDIYPDEEILLDYGDAWQQAWDEHVLNWKPPVTGHRPMAFDYDVADEIYAVTEPEYPGSWIQVRCWVDRDVLEAPSNATDSDEGDKDDNDKDDDDAWHVWKSFEGNDIEDTEPCTVLSADLDAKGKKESYRVQMTKDDLKVKNVPWRAITFVDQPYTARQFLRSSFRHEIQLPDDVFPDKWKDLVSNDSSEQQCGLYMAESAIPHAGWGMYTAQPIADGAKIFFGDLVIQAEDVELNAKLRHWSKGNVDYDEPDWLLEHYYWDSTVTHAHYDAPSIESIIPGLGMLANSHPGLVNAMIRPPLRTTDLHRGRDAGNGAATDYHDLHYTAKGDIVAGSELYVQYGDEWFEHREDLGMIPLSGDFEEADELVQEFWKQSNQSIASERAQELWTNMIKLAEEEPRVLSAMPKSIQDIPAFVEHGSAALSTPNRVQSLEWLQQHGTCLDHIKPGKSTLPQAGRGAFATRRLRAGQVIAPMPVVHLRRHHMGVYGGMDYDDPEAEVWFEGHQLLLNYCYGHPDSSLLLFPYSPVVNYVNHRHEAPNAAIQWSTTLSSEWDEWKDRTPDDLDQETHAGLVLELVALRDISPGEEVFVSYGDNWESAWQSHVQQYDKGTTREEEEYVSAAMMNERIVWLKTQYELLTDPYESDTVFTVCFVGELLKEVKDKENDEEETDEEDDKMKTYHWTNQKGIYESFDTAFPCEILSRDQSENVVERAYDTHESVKPVRLTYTVLVHRSKKEGGDAHVTRVPRLAIRFFDQEYMADGFRRRSFRHEIQLPDDMIPPTWRDLQQPEQQEEVVVE